MMMLIINFLILLSIMIILININMIISKKKNKNREKNSSFECGFNPITPSRIPFSIHFFLITLLFLIFDVEITILLPFLITFNKCNMKNYLTILYSFLMILLIGIFHEWNQNILTWKI
nr:NADH dehydrogenase subunit 3 [Paduniella sp. LP-2022]